MNEDQEESTYVTNYINKSLDEVNRDSERYSSYANETEHRYINQLMFLSATFLAIVGGFLANSNIELPAGLVGPVKLVILFLTISLCFGLATYKSIYNFWNSVAKDKHKEGIIWMSIAEQNARELSNAREKVKNYRESLGVKKSSDFCREMQSYTFIFAIILFTYVVIELI